jgi:methyl-accepting chemotaxis protein
VNVGSALVGRAGKTMDGVVGAVQQVTTLIAEISTASQEQSASVDQVSSAIIQMDALTQQNTAMVEKSSATAETFESQSLALTQAVSAFKLHEATELANSPTAQVVPARAAPRVPAVAARAPAARIARADNRRDGDWKEF